MNIFKFLALPIVLMLGACGSQRSSASSEDVIEFPQEHIRFLVPKGWRSTWKTDGELGPRCTLQRQTSEAPQPTIHITFGPKLGLAANKLQIPPWQLVFSAALSAAEPNAVPTNMTLLYSPDQQLHEVRLEGVKCKGAFVVVSDDSSKHIELLLAVAAAPDQLEETKLTASAILKQLLEE